MPRYKHIYQSALRISFVLKAVQLERARCEIMNDPPVVSNPLVLVNNQPPVFVNISSILVNNPPVFANNSSIVVNDPAVFSDQSCSFVNNSSVVAKHRSFSSYEL